MQTFNLLQLADQYTQQVAREFTPRPQFAFAQTLSNKVKLNNVYNDDADVCFVFTVASVAVDVYCNYMDNGVCGYVYVRNVSQALDILSKHFAINNVTYTNLEDNAVYFSTN